MLALQYHLYPTSSSQTTDGGRGLWGGSPQDKLGGGQCLCVCPSCGLCVWGVCVCVCVSILCLVLIHALTGPVDKQFVERQCVATLKQLTVVCSDRAQELACGGMVVQVQEAFAEVMTSVVQLAARYPIASCSSIGLLCTLPYTR